MSSELKSEVECVSKEELLNITQKEEFAKNYQLTESLLTETNSKGLQALEQGAILGQLVETIKQTKGSKFIEWLQGIGDTKIRNQVLEFARKANITQKKGKQLDTNQLSLVLCAEDVIKNEPVKRNRRETTCKWIRYAAQAKQSLHRDIEDKPLEEWDKEEARQAWTLLRPMLETALKLKEIAEGAPL